MGDPRRIKKKYQTPSHPWQLDRMEEEGILVNEYGFKNKREVWKMRSVLKHAADEAKRLIVATGPQATKEEKQLISRLSRYGLVPVDATIDNVLGLTLRDILERRLQTLVYKKGLAHSIHQARQFITHNHIQVGGKTINAPSYLVLQSEEGTVVFDSVSSLNNAEHPERTVTPTKKHQINKEKQDKQKGERGGRRGGQSRGRRPQRMPQREMRK